MNVLAFLSVMQGKTPCNLKQTCVVQGAMFIFNMPFQGRPGCSATWPDSLSRNKSSQILTLKVACSAGIFFERAICLRKCHVETSRIEDEVGLERGGGGEREEKTPARKHCENEKHPLIRRA